MWKSKIYFSLFIVSLVHTACSQDNDILNAELNSIAAQNDLVGMTIIVTENNEIAYSNY